MQCLYLYLESGYTGLVGVGSVLHCADFQKNLRISVLPQMFGRIHHWSHLVLGFSLLHGFWFFHFILVFWYFLFLCSQFCCFVCFEEFVYFIWVIQIVDVYLFIAFSHKLILGGMSVGHNLYFSVLFFTSLVFLSLKRFVNFLIFSNDELLVSLSLFFYL